MKPWPPSADSTRLAIGAVVALAIAGLIVALLAAIWLAAIPLAADPVPGARTDLIGLLAGTVWQATLTTLLSLMFGIATAFALDRLRFGGRPLVLALISAAIVTPGIVIAFAIVSVWGRAGWAGRGLEMFGMDLPGTIFGLGGILTAHLVLNGSLVTLVLLARLRAIPAPRLKIGQSLALSPLARFVLIDWPALSTALPGLAALVFLLAFTSFPVVLLLGGGPANQTFEVAIYTAVRLDFDLTGAVRLALVQLAVAAIIIIPATAYTATITPAGTGPDHYWADPWPVRLIQIAILVPAIVFLALPMAAVFAGLFAPGLNELLVRPSFLAAAGNSFAIATASAALAVVLGYGVAAARASLIGRTGPGLPLARNLSLARMALGLPAFAYLGVPAVVLSLGFFLTVRNLGGDPAGAAAFVLVLANALMSLPFVLAALGPPLDGIARRYGRLETTLNLSATSRFVAVEWPLLARPASFVFVLAFCFSFGDLGVISLFGTDRFSTLPWMMMQAMGAYRTTDANIIAAILALVTVTVFLGVPALANRFFHAQA
jgi:thiamine transport system permease protein